MKQCTYCKQIKQKSNFGKDSKTLDGLNYNCKLCVNRIGRNFCRTKVGLTRRIYITQVKSSIIRGHEKPIYSKEQLTGWIFNQKNFCELYDNWVDSNYDSNLKPSCDRIKDKLGYSFDNIILVTWLQNKENNYFKIRNGINDNSLKSVSGVSNDGTIIKFHSVREAERRTAIRHISANCRGERKSAGGYKWKYE